MRTSFPFSVFLILNGVLLLDCSFLTWHHFTLFIVPSSPILVVADATSKNIIEIFIGLIMLLDDFKPALHSGLFFLRWLRMKNLLKEKDLSLLTCIVPNSLSIEGLPFMVHNFLLICKN